MTLLWDLIKMALVRLGTELLKIALAKAEIWYMDRLTNSMAGA